MKCLILIWMLEEQHQTKRKTNILCGNLQFVLVWLLSDFRNDCWWLRHNARFSFLLLLSNPTVTIYYCGPTVFYTVHNILIPWMLRNHLERLRKKNAWSVGRRGVFWKCQQWHSIEFKIWLDSSNAINISIRIAKFINSAENDIIMTRSSSFSG